MNSSALYNQTVVNAPKQTFFGLERKKVNQANREELIVSAPAKADISKKDRSDTSISFRISGDAQYVMEQRYVAKNEGKIYGLRVPSVINRSENLHTGGHLAEIGNAGLSQYPQHFTNGMYKDAVEGERLEFQL
jgi:hypothetical protein